MKFIYVWFLKDAEHLQKTSAGSFGRWDHSNGGENTSGGLNAGLTNKVLGVCCWDAEIQTDHESSYEARDVAEVCGGGALTYTWHLPANDARPFLNVRSG